MYRRKLNDSFLDEFEPVETSVAVAALATLTVMLLLVPQTPAGGVIGDHVRPGELVVRIWVFAAVLIQRSGSSGRWAAASYGVGTGSERRR